MGQVPQYFFPQSEPVFDRRFSFRPLFFPHFPFSEIFHRSAQAHRAIQRCHLIQSHPDPDTGIL